jgi:GTP-binding protein
LSRPDAALLMVDSRHPGLASDVEAWRWLGSLGLPSALVATKIDKLGRAERARAGRELERSFNSPVLPVSAATGEGMDALWKLIATIVSPNPNPPSRP